MGVNDTRRFRAFVEFIVEYFPRADSVADIGGGKGTLSFFLRELGVRSTIIDVRDANHSGWVYRALRKRSIKAGRLLEIPRIVAAVQDIDLSAFDLVVGLHPDEATEHIVRAANQHHIPFAVVPCCVFPIDKIKRSREDWMTYLTTLTPNTSEYELPIEGANKVLYHEMPC